MHSIECPASSYHDIYICSLLFCAVESPSHNQRTTRRPKSTSNGWSSGSRRPYIQCVLAVTIRLYYTCFAPISFACHVRPAAETALSADDAKQSIERRSDNGN